ncbi:MAG: sugar phosphate isomerase/epimerase family protein [Clostridia bacterium]|nr:sugar phosphate isomerase/epimerase family protein [Clostridia bacterium]
MKKFPIGVMMESFRTDYQTALKTAADLGADGVQIYARGQFDMSVITKEKTRELKDVLASNALVVSAVCGDLGHGFGNPELNPSLIDTSKKIMEWAAELGTDIVTTHIGVVPPDPKHPRYGIMQDACGQLCRYADDMGAHFAIETGPETAQVLKGFLDSLGSRGVAVNLDPANLVMVTGDDPVAAVDILKDYIVHTHAKDGIKLLDKSPEVIYGLEEDKMLNDPAFKEVPLGEGSVDFPNYLKALEAIGYHGFLTIEREVGDNPKGDIEKAAAFLRNLMNL